MVMETLKNCLKEKALVAINREMIDSLSVYGFILGMSDSLVLLKNVYNLDFDGFRLIRTQDITDAFSEDEEKFLQSILKSEGLCDFEAKSDFDLTGLKPFLRKLSDIGENVIIQCEGYEENYFYEGKIEEVKKGEIILKTFNDTGFWEEERANVPLSRITSVSFGGRYIKLVSKYLK